MSISSIISTVPSYDPFYYAFYISSGLVLSITSTFITLLSINLYEKSKIQIMLLMSDVLYIAVAFSYNFGNKQDGMYWLLYLVFISIYRCVYTLYPTMRCFYLLSFKLKIYAIITNVFVNLAFFLVAFIENMIIGRALLGIAIPMPFILSIIIFYKIIKLVSGNPLYRDNQRQRAIFMLAIVSIGCIALLGCAVVVLLVLDGPRSTRDFKGIAYALTNFIKFVFVVMNSGLTAIKSLPDNDFCLMETSLNK